MSRNIIQTREDARSPILPAPATPGIATRPRAAIDVGVVSAGFPDAEYYIVEPRVREPVRRRSSLRPDRPSRASSIRYSSVLDRPSLSRRQDSAILRRPTNDWDSYMGHNVAPRRSRETLSLADRSVTRRGLPIFRESEGINPAYEVERREYRRGVSTDEEIRHRPRVPARRMSPSPIIINPASEETDNVQTVWNSTTKQDATVHFELAIDNNVRGNVEEFTRLFRLGNYHAADEYFQKCLLEYVDSPAFAMSYADLLLEQGAYNRFYEFAENVLPLEPDQMGDEQELITTKFILTVACADMRAGGNLAHAFEVIEEALAGKALSSYLHPSGNISSVAVQIMARILEIVGHTRRHSNFCHELRSDTWNAYDWRLIYKKLLKEDRIWDAKDILCASIFAFGVSKTWQNLFSVKFYTPYCFEEILKDWATEQYDESTYLAMLDIFIAVNDAITSASRLSSSESLARSIKSTRKRCMDHARRFAVSIRLHSPENVKSRPYVRWLLAEESLARQSSTLGSNSKTCLSALSSQNFSQSPGIVVTMMTSPHTVYIPIQAENPGWCTSSDPPSSMLTLALRAAQDLDDFRTQVVCLRELISQSSHPSELFLTLIKLQTDVQGDSIGHLETILSKYLLLSDNKSYKSLLEELNMWRGEFHDINFQDPMMEWCLSTVRSSLYLELGQHSQKTLRQNETDSGFDQLPEDLEDLLQQGFKRLGGKASTHISGSKGEVYDADSDYDVEVHVAPGRPNEFHKAQELSSAVISRNSRVADDPFESVVAPPLARVTRSTSYIRPPRSISPRFRTRERGERELRFESPSPAVVERRERPRSPGYAQTIVSPAPPPVRRRAFSNDLVERRSVALEGSNDQLVRYRKVTMKTGSGPDDGNGKSPAEKEPEVDRWE